MELIYGRITLIAVAEVNRTNVIMDEFKKSVPVGYVIFWYLHQPTCLMSLPPQSHPLQANWKALAAEHPQVKRR